MVVARVLQIDDHLIFEDPLSTTSLMIKS